MGITCSGRDARLGKRPGIYDSDGKAFKSSGSDCCRNGSNRNNRYDFISNPGSSRTHHGEGGGAVGERE
mgnify:CR=1 FL=1